MEDKKKRKFSFCEIYQHEFTRKTTKEINNDDDNDDTGDNDHDKNTNGALREPSFLLTDIV
ncbi:Hypothetical predicted protein [Xyrichtys novacula]|uniref:Uncharacterized protein n=1 Tax=Xyrichtys novacula TaxID=13765 RepID=A0AAV1FDB3_XYRNO|nr:Hypothetical predicted protein [Xyrichtys novacula]